MFLLFDNADMEHLETARRTIADKTGCAGMVVRNNPW